MANLGDPLEGADATQRYLLSLLDGMDADGSVSPAYEAALKCHNETVIALAAYRNGKVPPP